MKLYNTLTRSKQEFVPIKENEVKMYSCGPTVYNLFHIGNARPFIVFDTLRRYLEYKGYKVTFVQNFTDVDDKLIAQAQREGLTVAEVAEKYIDEYYRDAEGLGIKKADVHPRATENIEEIIKLIETLIEKGHAYEVEGDVYFDTKSFPEYGKLSHQPLEELEAGARIDVGEKKKEAMDFALWKAEKPGEISWESPWGDGRPGWHIECSAMAQRFLGESIDIHSGGRDLIFPHHENEIAQSEAASGCCFANYWLHNGYINIDNTKMSKSKGNFFTVRDIAEKYGYEVVRFFMLSAHYRSPINFSDELLAAAKTGMERLYNSRNSLRDAAGGAGVLPEDAAALRDKFFDAMDDDLNTADAIAALFELARLSNTLVAEEVAPGVLAECLKLMEELCDILGILTQDEDTEIDDKIQKLIDERQRARENRDFARADEIRDTLKEQGIILEDTRDGVKWKKEQL